MKKLMIILLVSVVAISAFGQEEKLLKKEIERGAFAGPLLKFTHLNGKFGFLLGARGGWIINHSFSVGGGCYFLTNEINANQPYRHLLVKMGYGGLVLEDIFQSRKLTHFTISMLIGAGGVTLKESSASNEIPEDKSDPFFIAEPEFSFMLNFAENFRIGVGVSYRFISGISLAGISDSDLRGFSINLTFKFGKF